MLPKLLGWFSLGALAIAAVFVILSGGNYSIPLTLTIVAIGTGLAALVLQRIYA